MLRVQLTKGLSGVLILLICIFLSIDSYAFELKGFGNVNFEKVSGLPDSEQRHGSFVLGDLDIYISEQIDDKIDVLAEILFELEEEAADVERFHIGYMINESVKIKVGRFHTPIGFWNTAFHHGMQLQPTIDRPEILKFEFEGGIIPAHTVGVNLTGKVRRNSSIVSYDLMIGNGDRIVKKKDGSGDMLSPNIKSDDNYDKSVAFAISLKPGKIDGMRIGLSGNIQRVQSGNDILISGNPIDTEQLIIAPAISYHLNNLEIIGEYFYLTNNDKGMKVENKTGTGYYVLFTYNIDDKWTPYILQEGIDVKSGDRYFEALNARDLIETIIGFKYNITYRSCIKMEGRTEKIEKENFNEFAAQWAISF